MTKPRTDAELKAGTRPRDCAGQWQGPGQVRVALLVTVPTSEQVMDQAERLECAVKYVGPAGSACWPDPAGPRHNEMSQRLSACFSERENSEYFPNVNVRDGL